MHNVQYTVLKLPSISYTIIAAIFAPTFTIQIVNFYGKKLITEYLIAENSSINVTVNTHFCSTNS